MASSESKVIPRGLTTINILAKEIDAAKEWYTKVFEVAPYLDVPGPDGATAYVEWRVGDYLHEFGILADGALPTRQPTDRPAGAVVYWAVGDIDGAYQRLLDLGATPYEPPQDVGALGGEPTGYVTASVIDPFGNIFGLFFNPHYDAVLAEARKGLTDLSDSPLARADEH